MSERMNVAVSLCGMPRASAHAAALAASLSRQLIMASRSHRSSSLVPPYTPGLVPDETEMVTVLSTVASPSLVSTRAMVLTSPITGTPPGTKVETSLAKASGPDEEAGCRKISPAAVAAAAGVSSGEPPQVATKAATRAPSASPASTKMRFRRFAGQGVPEAASGSESRLGEALLESNDGPSEPSGAAMLWPLDADQLYPVDIVDR